MPYRIERDFKEMRSGREFKTGQIFDVSPFDDTRLAAYLGRGWVVEVAEQEKPARRKAKAEGESD